MPVADRTYSFKASASLGERVRRASCAIVEGRSDQELVLELARRLAADLPNGVAEATEGERTNQSALFRSLLEALVAAVEDTTAERKYAAEYAAMASERDADAEGFARAAFGSSAALWREDD